MKYRIHIREFDVVTNEVIVDVEADDSDEAIEMALEGHGHVVSTEEVDRTTEEREPLDCYPVSCVSEEESEDEEDE